MKKLKKMSLRRPRGKLTLTSIGLSLVIMTSCAFIQRPALAAKKDLDQKIKITSGRLGGDLKNKIASYLDNVIIRQGSISITADIVQVITRKDDTDIKEADTYIAQGKPNEPAMFKQELEDGSLISLQADEIKYQPHINIITVSGNAVVKQAGSEVSGSKIIYNTLTEKLEAQSNDNETVTTILQPTILKSQKEKKALKDREGGPRDQN